MVRALNQFSGRVRLKLGAGVEYFDLRMLLPYDYYIQVTYPLFIYSKLLLLVYTTQVNSTFRARWLASLEVISQVLFTSEQPKKNKMAFVPIFSQIKLLFGPLVIQLVWYILKQLFTSVSVKVVDIYLAASRLGKYPPLFTSTSVNNC